MEGRDYYRFNHSGHKGNHPKITSYRYMLMVIPLAWESLTINPDSIRNAVGARQFYGTSLRCYSNNTKLENTLVNSMDISTKPLEEVIRKLSPDLRAEVQTFIDILLKQVAQNGKTKLRQDWAGMLKADTYTSVELQHLAVAGRNG